MYFLHFLVLSLLDFETLYLVFNIKLPLFHELKGKKEVEKDDANVQSECSSIWLKDKCFLWHVLF